MKKRLIALGLTAAMAVAMVGCGSAESKEKESGTPSTETTTTADGKTYNIGVCQLLQHPALDAQCHKKCHTERPIHYSNCSSCPHPCLPVFHYWVPFSEG